MFRTVFALLCIASVAQAERIHIVDAFAIASIHTGDVEIHVDFDRPFDNRLDGDRLGFTAITDVTRTSLSRWIPEMPPTVRRDVEAWFWFTNGHNMQAGQQDRFGPDFNYGSAIQIEGSDLTHVRENAGLIDYEIRGTTFTATIPAAYLNFATNQFRWTVVVADDHIPGQPYESHELSGRSAIAAPEPAAWSLMVIGVAGLLGHRLVRRPRLRECGRERHAGWKPIAPRAIVRDA